MSLWALSGNMIGKAFNDGFNQGFNTADKEMLERRQLQYKLDLERKEKERQAKQLGDLADKVMGKDKFKNNYTPQQLNIFGEAQNSTPIPLQATQEPQASPNNNNINYSSLFDAYKTNGSPINQETLNNGVQNYREAFNTWKADKPYTNEQWALADVLNDGNYSAAALMGKELDKIFNPIITHKDYFDEDKKAYMRQDYRNGQLFGDPYMTKPYESQADLLRLKGSGSGNKYKQTYKVINGVEHRVIIDEQGRIIKDLGVTENALKNFRTEQIKNGYDPKVVVLAEQALWTSGDKAFAIDILNGRYNTVRTIDGFLGFDTDIDLAEKMTNYNVEKGNYTKGNGEQIVKLLNDYADVVVRDFIKYGESVLDLVPKEMRDNEKFKQMIAMRLNGYTTPANKKEISEVFNQ